MVSVGQVSAEVTLDASKFNRGLSGVKSGLKGVESHAAMAKNAIIGIGVAAAGLTAVAYGFTQITKAAMEAVESENLFEVSMGRMAGAARAWSKEVSEAVGLNEYAVRKSVGTFNVMLNSMGLAEKEAYKMSTALTELSYDMASFYDRDPEIIFTKIRGGITGETEGLKELGININETMIKQEAYTNGIAKQGAKLTEVQKIQARYLSLMSQTSKAQGDLERTIDSPANAVRRLQAEYEQLSITLGKKLLPLQTDIVKSLIGVVDAMDKSAQGYDAWEEKNQALIKTVQVATAAVVAFGVANTVLASGIIPRVIAGIVRLNATIALMNSSVIAVNAAGVAAATPLSKLSLIGASLKALVNPVTVVTALLGALAVVAYQYGQRAEEATKKTERLMRKLASLDDEVSGLFQQLEILASTTDKTVKQEEKLIDVKEDLIRQFPKYKDIIEEEIKKHGEINEKLKQRLMIEKDLQAFSALAQRRADLQRQLTDERQKLYNIKSYQPKGVVRSEVIDSQVRSQQAIVDTLTKDMKRLAIEQGRILDRIERRQERIETTPAKPGQPDKTKSTTPKESIDYGFTPPVKARISSGYGPRKAPTAGASTFHQGIDYALPSGSSVKASKGGKIIHVGKRGGLGNSVIIDHGNGFESMYNHLLDGVEEISKVGQVVEQGQVIGRVGSTGISTGSHLDFRIREKNAEGGYDYKNPLDFLGKPGKKKKFQEPEFFDMVAFESQLAEIQEGYAEELENRLEYIQKSQEAFKYKAEAEKKLIEEGLTEQSAGYEKRLQLEINAMAEQAEIRKRGQELIASTVEEIEESTAEQIADIRKRGVENATEEEKKVQEQAQLLIQDVRKVGELNTQQALLMANSVYLMKKQEQELEAAKETAQKLEEERLKLAESDREKLQVDNEYMLAMKRAEMDRLLELEKLNKEEKQKLRREFFDYATSLLEKEIEFVKEKYGEDSEEYRRLILEKQRLRNEFSLATYRQTTQDMADVKQSYYELTEDITYSFTNAFRRIAEEGRNWKDIMIGLAFNVLEIFAKFGANALISGFSGGSGGVLQGSFMPGNLVGSFASGGIVPGDMSKHYPAMVGGGEMILNKRQQENLFSLLNGGTAMAAQPQQQRQPVIVLNNTFQSLDPAQSGKIFRQEYERTIRPMIMSDMTSNTGMRNSIKRVN